MRQGQRQQLGLGFPAGKSQQSGFPASLLKSAIQKNVRRGNVSGAVKCAKLLLHKKPLEFWRRLPIIVLDDCILHPAFPEIVNTILKVQSKYYQPNATDEKLGLTVVEEITRCPVRDLEFLSFQRQLRQLEELPSLSKISELPEEEAELIRAIVTRKTLGGMSGDQEMMEINSRLWIKRFLDKTFSVQELQGLFPPAKINYKQISLEENLEDIPLEAVDFHISPMLHILLSKDRVREILREHWPNASESDFKTKLESIIWHQRSSLNTKEDIISGKIYDQCGYNILPENEQEKMQNVYWEIKDDLTGISRWFIKESLKI